MHIYAFGSVCRGEISLDSDVDLLAITEGYDSSIDPEIFSIYSYRRIREIWKEGNPFAWHLSLESRLLYSSDKLDFLRELDKPKKYTNCHQDCKKFFSLFCEAYLSLVEGSNSRVFDLSTVFLSIRNIATCFSLGISDQPDFSRNAALRLGVDSILIDLNTYSTLERARILCTRGYGEKLSHAQIDYTIKNLNQVHDWMLSLLEKVKFHE
jgi:hypothetical protein